MEWSSFLVPPSLRGVSVHLPLLPTLQAGIKQLLQLCRYRLGHPQTPPCLLCLKFLFFRTHKSQSNLNQGLYLPGCQGHPWSIALRGWGGQLCPMHGNTVPAESSKGPRPLRQSLTHSDHSVPLKQVRKISGWSENMLLSG